MVYQYISDNGTTKQFDIEIQNWDTPKWIHCILKYDANSRTWVASVSGKNRSECGDIFTGLVNRTKLFGGEIPPFKKRSITHDEWKKIKSETTQWDDVSVDIPNDTIRRLYTANGCSYIQINNGYGLYHLGNDVCGLGVPEFTPPQQLSVRTKIRAKKNTTGFCDMYITCTCQPKDITTLQPSSYSLDDKNKLPPNVRYVENK